MIVKTPLVLDLASMKVSPSDAVNLNFARSIVSPLAKPDTVSATPLV